MHSKQYVGLDHPIRLTETHTLIDEVVDFFGRIEIVGHAGVKLFFINMQFLDAQCQHFERTREEIERFEKKTFRDLEIALIATPDRHDNARQSCEMRLIRLGIGSHDFEDIIISLLWHDR